MLLGEVGGIADSLGYKIGVTTAKTGHRFLTVSGHKSRHMDGEAVDITSINGEPVTSKKGMAMADKFVQLLEKNGYTRNSESGNPRAVLWKTHVGGNHFNHIHISNKKQKIWSSTNPYEDLLKNL